MDNRTFVELWKSLTSSERDNLTIAIVKKCNLSIATIPGYACGARVPKQRSKEVIARLLRTQGYDVDQKTLFPN